ncbi:MAG TPA: hypothetical protein VF657_17620, partial [Actinoplanes sp.]
MSSILNPSMQRAAARVMAVLTVGIGALAVSTAPSSAADGTGSPTVVVVGSDQVEAAGKELTAKLEQSRELLSADTSAAGQQAVARVREELAAARLAVHLPAGASAAGTEATVFVAGTGQRIVHVPYVGSVVKPSGLTVAFDAAGAVTESFEAVYQARSETSGTVA